MYTSTIETPVGAMIAIADEENLHLLEFIGRRDLEWEIERLKARAKCPIVEGYTKPIISIEEELNLYFKGNLKEFKTPLFLFGSPFQKKVWMVLVKIPYGETRSYAELATAIGKPTAFRAVAQANGANQLAIVIPCHRVINKSGALGGYAAGLMRKDWLLNLEKKLP